MSRAHLDDGSEVCQLGHIVPLDGPGLGLLRRGQQIQALQLLDDLGFHLGMLADCVHHPGRRVARSCRAMEILFMVCSEPKLRTLEAQQSLVAAAAGIGQATLSHRPSCSCAGV